MEIMEISSDKNKTDAGVMETSDIDVVAETVKPAKLTYEQRVANCSVIAKPMCSKKLAQKCYKLIKKASRHKTYLRYGLKDVQRRIGRGEIGIAIFAGDVFPIKIMCHLPIVCEENKIPYAYVPSRADLGAALGVKRRCITVLIREHSDYEEAFNEIKNEINGLPPAF